MYIRMVLYLKNIHIGYKFYENCNQFTLYLKWVLSNKMYTILINKLLLFRKRNFMCLEIFGFRRKKLFNYILLWEKKIYAFKKVLQRSKQTFKIRSIEMFFLILFLDFMDLQTRAISIFNIKLIRSKFLTVHLTFLYGMPKYDDNVSNFFLFSFTFHKIIRFK